MHYSVVFVAIALPTLHNGSAVFGQVSCQGTTLKTDSTLLEKCLSVIESLGSKTFTFL